MKMFKFIAIAFLIVSIIYVLYLVIGMSSTYPPIKKYEFGVSQVDFNQKLIDRIRNSEGWSFEQRDSLKEKEGEACYSTSLVYQRNEQHIEYILKYCFGDKRSIGNDECTKVAIVSIIDYKKQSNSRKLPAQDVEKLVQILDHALLDRLAPSCSN